MMRAIQLEFYNDTFIIINIYLNLSLQILYIIIKLIVNFFNK
jgi:hypothetical protein